MIGTETEIEGREVKGDEAKEREEGKENYRRGEKEELKRIELKGKRAGWKRYG